VTFVNAGTLGTQPGRRDELVARLIERNDLLRDLGCTVEVWESSNAHRASLQHPQVIAAITEARPLLSGAFGGFRFDSAGSPLRD
jgi:hypothetical protein